MVVPPASAHVVDILINIDDGTVFTLINAFLIFQVDFQNIGKAVPVIGKADGMSQFNDLGGGIIFLKFFQGGPMLRRATGGPLVLFQGHDLCPADPGFFSDGELVRILVVAVQRFDRFICYVKGSTEPSAMLRSIFAPV